MADSKMIPQLCLTVVCGHASGSADAQARLFEQTPFASILIEAPPGADTAGVTRLIRAAQEKGAAALVVVTDETQLQTVRSLGADGVHLAWHDKIEATYATARQIFGPRGIVGVDAGRSRHTAMSLAESGADYIGFGLDAGSDPASAHTERHELCAWWAEIFEVPVVALGVATPDEATRLASARVDFLCLDLRGHQPPALEDALGAIERALLASTLVESG